MKKRFTDEQIRVSKSISWQNGNGWQDKLRGWQGLTNTTLRLDLPGD